MGQRADPGTTPSDLADYAFCPRSYWYRYHPPPGGPSADGVRRVEAGERYHARTLRTARHHAEHGGTYWALVAVGLLVVVGGVLWLVL